MFILDRAKGFGMRVGLTSQEDAGWAEIGQGRQIWAYWCM
jgi:hypothetical protein